MQNQTDAQSWAAFLATTPFSPEARAAIERIETGTTDWLEARHGDLDDQEKKAILSRLTQKQYYMDYIGAPEQAIRQYQRNGHGCSAPARRRSRPATCGRSATPGSRASRSTDTPFPGIGRTPQFGLLPEALDSPSPTWPDGNSSLLRLLVDRLIPGAVTPAPGAPLDQETVVNATTDYSKLDRRGNHVRIRLNSLVFRVEPGRSRASPRRPAQAPRRGRLPDRRRAPRPPRAGDGTS